MKKEITYQYNTRRSDLKIIQDLVSLGSSPKYAEEILMSMKEYAQEKTKFVASQVIMEATLDFKIQLEV